MKLPFKCRNYFIAGLVMLVTLVLASSGLADTYHSADFSGGIFGGNANVKAPFLGYGFAPGGPASGSFVYDDQLIPAPGSGFVNVLFSSFPAIGKIPAATAFTINLGTTPLTFTLADDSSGIPAIQYNNGHFNGFFFQVDFLFQGSNPSPQPYQFDCQGGTWSIHAPGSFSNLVSGYINIGDGNLTNIRPYTPPAAPIPGSLLLLGSGLTALMSFRKKSA
jgi:hypothetical protein